jgi:hypothetical protein
MVFQIEGPTNRLSGPRPPPPPGSDGLIAGSYSPTALYSHVVLRHRSEAIFDRLTLRDDAAAKHHLGGRRGDHSVSADSSTGHLILASRASVLLQIEVQKSFEIAIRYFLGQCRALSPCACVIDFLHAQVPRFPPGPFCFCLQQKPLGTQPRMLHFKKACEYVAERVSGEL